MVIGCFGTQCFIWWIMKMTSLSEPILSPAFQAASYCSYWVKQCIFCHIVLSYKVRW
jgi:hypothetical protein